ncbi:hypothetical protein Tco_0448842 [Tanacetum coccineum]
MQAITMRSNPLDTLNECYADDDADDGDGIGDNDRDDDADDGDGNGDDEDGNLDDDGDRNGDGEDDKNPSGSNPSFGFSKISLEDVDKQPSGSVNSPKNQVVENESVDPTGDLFGQNLVTTKVLNQGPPTPDRMPTRASKVSPSPEKRIVKPSSYLVTRSHSGEFIVYGIRLNMETLAPGLWIDANTKSMFYVTLASDDDKWEIFSNQVKAQFKGNEGGLALKGIDLKKMFAHHLKLYGHNRHAQLQSDMLRRLRFKFATKILLHEVNVHANKMLDLAIEFDKVDPYQRMSIIVEAVKKREEHECI